MCPTEKCLRRDQAQRQSGEELRVLLTESHFLNQQRPEEAELRLGRRWDELQHSRFHRKCVPKECFMQSSAFSWVTINYITSKSQKPGITNTSLESALSKQLSSLFSSTQLKSGFDIYLKIKIRIFFKKEGNVNIYLSEKKKRRYFWYFIPTK